MLSEPEIWKPVPSVPGLLASSWGRVMVEPHEKRMPNGGARQYGGHPTYGVWVRDRQRFTYVYKRKTYKVHFLVCEAFNGERPFPKAVVMHDDEDPAHNWPKNLIWGTQKENLNYPGFKAKIAERNRQYALARMQVAQAA